MIALCFANFCEAACKNLVSANCKLKADISIDVTFQQCMDPSVEIVHVFGSVTGLNPGLHGFHVHAYGFPNITDDCLNAGPHFNPFKVNHIQSGKGP